MIALEYDNPHSALVYNVEQVINTATGGGVRIIHTSGTTGEPKPVSVDLRKALEKKRPGLPSERWLLTYNPRRWAGISVVLHCLKSECTLIVPETLEFYEIIAAGLRFNATHISLTPSMLRSLALYDTDNLLQAIPIKQVTFGGEAVTQSTIDLARRLWPAARVTHVYASTEHGDICSVSDGLAGIPAHKFAGYTFVDGELVIDGKPTGDIWTLGQNRYYFIGKVERIVNVGGYKVSLDTVELFAVKSGAQLARAYAIPSPIVGNLIGLEYVGGVDVDTLTEAYNGQYPKFVRPARITRVASLPLTDTGKVAR